MYYIYTYKQACDVINYHVDPVMSMKHNIIITS